MIRSAISRIRGSWVTITVVVPRALPRDFSIWTNVVAGLFVQGGGGFVCQDYFGVGHQRPRNRDPLFLPARQVAGQSNRADLQGPADQGCDAPRRVVCSHRPSHAPEAPSIRFAWPSGFRAGCGPER